MEGDQENRDNTRRFLGANGTSREREEREELELSLGLSTNGRFGVDLASKKMRRSSSVSNIVLNVDCAGNEQARGAELGGQAPLARTCSLPPEFDSEARVRMEKLKSVDGGEGLNADGNESFDANMARDGIQDFRVRKLPKASIESRGQQSHLVKGAPQTTKTGGSCAVGGPTVLVANTDEALLKNALVDMPYVSTKGFGNKIEGFLYRYKRGEEVKIVCVCHGMFLSPAEFVKHGGGGDVAYPLKHIVVNPFPLY